MWESRQIKVSGDGCQIAYLHPSEREENKIHLYRLGETKPHTVIDLGTSHRHLTWSRDGSSLAFTVEGLKNTLYRIDCEGENLCGLMTVDSIDGLVYSDDGHHLLVTELAGRTIEQINAEPDHSRLDHMTLTCLPDQTKRLISLAKHSAYRQTDNKSHSVLAVNITKLEIFG